MNEYRYCVNTFSNGKPVQISGYVEAESEDYAILKLIDDGTVYRRGYEFLELALVFENPTAYEKLVIARMREEGMSDEEIERFLREI